jgi:eukaryotic-like serine/threonine-protein kinase
MTTVPLQLTAALAGRYTIERELGRGGMATVYLARDIRHERRVAVKVLDPELGASLGTDRFLAEIRVTANLQHPNVLPLFDSGDADGLLFYVMPYVEGESLRAKLDREKRLSVEEALRISTAVASALDYAHRQGVVHRDVKPENVLLSDGVPVVADFGIAKAVSSSRLDGATHQSGLTQVGLALGTPAYMSPEQAMGETVDGRTDVYALGCMLYEMLSGDVPFTGPSAQSVIAKHLTAAVPSIRDARDTVPSSVEATIKRAMAKEPSRA